MRMNVVELFVNSFAKRRQREDAYRKENGKRWNAAVLRSVSLVSARPRITSTHLVFTRDAFGIEL